MARILARLSRDAPPRAQAQAASAPGIGGALLRVGIALMLVYGGLVGALGWWQVAQAGPLTADPRNPLVLGADQAARRGRILAAGGETLAVSQRRAGSEWLRRYPRPESAPVTGYRSRVFGSSALERAYDRQLMGLDQAGPADDIMRKLRAQAYLPADVWTTMDARLQRAAAAALGDRRGAVVAIEPSTGRILALATSPTYDPNVLADPQSGREYLDRLLGRRGALLLDRATRGLYVPGSVFKVVTLIAGLESGALEEETRFPGQPTQSRQGLAVRGALIRDAPRDVQLDHPLDLFEATEVSSNVWFARAALAMGPDALLEGARRLGFGAPVAMDLPVSISQVTDDEGRLAGFADRVELATAAFGQGEVLATPLQMAMVAAAVGNDGTLMEPRLVDRLTWRDGSEQAPAGRAAERAMSAETAEIVTRAMVRAVEGPFAAPYAGGARIRGVTVAGKSGTAQLARGDPHSWFIGFAPAEKPRIAIAVVVERAGPGSERAVPIGGDLIRGYLARLERDGDR